MARTTTVAGARSGRGRQRPPAAADAKKLRSFRLASRKIAAARRILGTPTDTETIEAALDAVVFRDALVVGTRAAFGIRFDGTER